MISWLFSSILWEEAWSTLSDEFMEKVLGRHGFIVTEWNFDVIRLVKRIISHVIMQIPLTIDMLSDIVVDDCSRSPSFLDNSHDR